MKKAKSRLSIFLLPYILYQIFSNTQFAILSFTSFLPNPLNLVRSSKTSIPNKSKPIFHIRNVRFKPWDNDLLILKRFGGNFPVHQIVTTKVNRILSYDEIEHDVKLLKRLIAERRENLKVKVTARVDKFNGNNLFSLLKRKNDDTIKNVQVTFELALSSKNNDFQQAGRL